MKKNKQTPFCFNLPKTYSVNYASTKKVVVYSGKLQYFRTYSAAQQALRRIKAVFFGEELEIVKNQKTFQERVKQAEKEDFDKEWSDISKYEEKLTRGLKKSRNPYRSRVHRVTRR